MSSSYKGSLISTAALALLATLIPICASAQYGPPDIVVSVGGNTAAGSSALQSNYLGANNTAVGQSALQSNTTASYNTAVGWQALLSNTTGDDNSAFGANALIVNLGEQNSAFGSTALGENTTGYANVAVGYSTLYNNNAGNENTAIGAQALAFNGGGNGNTAAGANAALNSLGNYNTATGYDALFSGTVAFYIPNGTGNYNTASGYQSLYSNSTGSNNTAIGVGALQLNTIGGNNIALGAYAGANVTVGWRNIDIGNVGAKGDAGTIRIGTSGQHLATYVAGINGVHLTGSAVYISSSGQLGVLASSERYKTAIEPMAQRTEKLKQLRPVTFHLKTDPKGVVQYGLIAEEVAKVYPELVIRGEKGQVEGVRYEELAPMLLNEVQQQAAELLELRHQLAQIQAALKSSEGGTADPK